MIYTITVIVCLVSYIFLNWYDQMDLTLSDLAVFSLMSVIPAINIVFLIYIGVSIVFRVDLSDIPTITILKGKK